MMTGTCENLPKTRILIQETIRWANTLERLPVAYLQEDRTPFRARPAPVLEFVYHASGSDVRVELGPYSYVSEPGSVLVLGTCDGYRATPRDVVSAWNLSLYVPEDALVPGLHETPLLLAARAPVSNRVIERYRVAVHGYRQQRLCQDIQLKCEVIGVLVALLEALGGGDEGAARRSGATAAAIDFIHRFYNRADLRRSDLAAAARISEAHLARLFVEEMGMSPMRYLNEFRITRACDLLDRTHLNVEEVGRTVGLPAPSHFSRVFKALQGISPRAYRDQSAGWHE